MIKLFHEHYRSYMSSNAMSFGRWLAAFWRELLPPYGGTVTGNHLLHCMISYPTVLIFTAFSAQASFTI